MIIHTWQDEVEWRENYENASKLLNEYYEFYKGGLHPILEKWVEICIQCLIFQVDISFEIANICVLKPVGFSRKIAFKGLLLRLVEFRNQFDVRTINEDLRDYIAEMNVDLGEVQLIYPSNELASLRKILSANSDVWSDLKEIRNDAAGHYRRLNIQVPALEAIDPDKVFEIAHGLSTYVANVLSLIVSIHPKGLKLSKYTPEK